MPTPTPHTFHPPPCPSFLPLRPSQQIGCCGRRRTHFALRRAKWVFCEAQQIRRGPCATLSECWISSVSSGSALPFQGRGERCGASLSHLPVLRILAAPSSSPSY